MSIEAGCRLVWNRFLRGGVLPLLLGAGAALAADKPAPASRNALVTSEGAQPDHPGEAQEFYVKKRSPDGTSPLDNTLYVKASEQMKKMPLYSSKLQAFIDPGNKSATALGTWTPLGPGNVGGRTRAILIHPTTPATMWAAGVAGGVWKTTNAGATWAPIGDFLANIAVNSMVLDPSDPNVIYAGTGEGYFNQDGVRGAGIFKTTNGGTNWTQLANTATSDFYYVNSIVVSNLNTMHVYAGTRTGLWRSLDGGATWLSVLGVPANNGCTHLVKRTDQSTDTVFAACGTFAQATIYRNTDAGAAGTWDAVYTEANMGRTSLAVAPSDQNTIYALASDLASGNYLYGLRAVFKSTTGGGSGSWTAVVRNTNPTKLNTLLLSNPVEAMLVECSFGGSDLFLNQGWYDNVIAVDPTNANTVWVGGIDLFRSVDGGANWQLASYWWDYPPTTGTDYSHADHHALVFHPGYNGTTNQILYDGNDGGIYRTDNAVSGTTSTDACANTLGSLIWTNLNNGYGTTQFYHGTVYPSGTQYFGGTQDNGTPAGSDGGGANAWTYLQGGDGGYTAIDPTNTLVLYAEFTRKSITKSTNGGTSFASAVSGITEASGNFLFIAPFTMDGGNAQRLWTGGFDFWRTINAATSWTQASAVTPGTGSISALAVSTSDGNFVLGGMSDGYICRTNIGLTSTSATTWANLQPRAGYVSSLMFEPGSTTVAYATYSTFGGGGHVWKSTNSGATWSDISGSGITGIPDLPVHWLVVHPGNNLRLYVGTDLGVFTSVDGGANWAVENTGFANVPVEALQFNGTTLFAFTHGRSAWKVNAPVPVDLIGFSAE